MLRIKQVHDQEEFLVLGSLKLDLMQYHLEYASQIGINDKELLRYTLEQALSTAMLRDNFIFLLDDKIIGMAQVEEQVSTVDDSSILFVHGIYIMPHARHLNIGERFLRYLCRRYKKRVECECWYGIPATTFYEKAGFKPMVTRYMLPLSSRFYGSDQN